MLKWVNYMDIQKIRKYQIFSVIFTFIFGTLLHFTYKWLGENLIVGAFSAVNESTWEHLKLLFFPMLVTIIIGYFNFNKTIQNFICSKTIGILIAIAFTIIFFYTYTGILGKNIALIDISLFFIAVILGEFISYLLIVNGFKCNKIISIAVLIVLFISFIVFTYKTPKIGLFKDPLTNLYGIYKDK